MSFIDRIDNIGAFLARPGKYHTTSGNPAYAVLQSLSWHPQVQIVEELFFVEGQAIFAEVVTPGSLTPNAATTGWGTTEDYYERRLRDYQDWEVAFWREIVQNSRDAGATRIDIECVEDVFEDPDSHERTPCVRCEVHDNGSGMDYDTMMSAFFRRGGSLKTEGSVGGFGDAKNLILTPWLGYKLRSNDAVAVGRHEELFSDLTKSGMPHHAGTTLTVWMPLQRTTTPEHAKYLIEQSTLRNIRFRVNGNPVRAAQPKGKLVKETPIIVSGKHVGEMLVYHSPRSRSKGVLVRSHGIFMYATGTGQYDFKGAVIVEVNAPPIDVFTTKRDGLSYASNARPDLEKLLQQLSVDPISAMRSSKDIKSYVYKGTGTINTREGGIAELAAQVVSAIDIAAAARRQKPGQELKLKKSDVQVLTDQLSEKLEEAGVNDHEGGPVSRPMTETFELMMSQPLVDTEHVTTAIHMAMWKPDFMVYQNISPWHMPKAMLPESMSNKYHLVIRAWTEICRFLLVQFGMDRPFGVGWGIESEYDIETRTTVTSGALYTHKEGIHWLLLNPLNINVTENYGDNAAYRTTTDRFNLSDSRSMEHLVALAVHEITHMQGFTGHNEAYAGALTKNLEAVFRVAPVLKKIIKAVRSSVREERSVAKKAKEASKTDKLHWTKVDDERNWESYIGYTEGSQATVSGVASLNKQGRGGGFRIKIEVGTLSGDGKGNANAMLHSYTENVYDAKKEAERGVAAALAAVGTFDLQSFKSNNSLYGQLETSPSVKLDERGHEVTVAISGFRFDEVETPDDYALLLYMAQAAGRAALGIESKPALEWDSDGTLKSGGRAVAYMDPDGNGYAIRLKLSDIVWRNSSAGCELKLKVFSDRTHAKNLVVYAVKKVSGLRNDWDTESSLWSIDLDGTIRRSGDVVGNLESHDPANMLGFTVIKVLRARVSFGTGDLTPDEIMFIAAAMFEIYEVFEKWAEWSNDEE